MLIINQLNKSEFPFSQSPRRMKSVNFKIWNVWLIKLQWNVHIKEPTATQVSPTFRSETLFLWSLNTLYVQPVFLMPGPPGHGWHQSDTNLWKNVQPLKHDSLQLLFVALPSPLKYTRGSIGFKIRIIFDQAIVHFFPLYKLWIVGKPRLGVISILVFKLSLITP